MKTISLIFILGALGLYFQSSAQRGIVLQKGSSSPVTDGRLSTGEWEGSTLVIPSVSGSRPVTVFYQMSDTAFHFAFAGNLANASNPNFPEIYFDLNYSKSAQWEADDHWFHVSATDCHFQGKHSDYSNCVKDPADWSARKNWEAGQFSPDTVEIEIPFRKLGFSWTHYDTIGIAFAVTNTSNRYDLWPTGAEIDKPLSWGYAARSKSTGNLEDFSNGNNGIYVYPNPSTHRVYLNLNQDHYPLKVRIWGIDGRLFRTITISSHSVDISSLPQGLYVLSLEFNHEFVNYPIIKQE